MMIVTGDHARTGGASVDIVGVEQGEGGLAPHLLSGRLPSGADEVALGRNTARQLHLHAGATLDLVRDSDDGHTDRAEYRVVGLVVVPTIAGNDGIGKGAVMTAPGFARTHDGTGLDDGRDQVATRGARRRAGAHCAPRRAGRQHRRRGPSRFDHQRRAHPPDPTHPVRSAGRAPAADDVPRDRRLGTRTPSGPRRLVGARRRPALDRPGGALADHDPGCIAARRRRSARSARRREGVPFVHRPDRGRARPGLPVPARRGVDDRARRRGQCRRVRTDEAGTPSLDGDAVTRPN